MPTSPRHEDKEEDINLAKDGRRSRSSSVDSVDSLGRIKRRCAGGGEGSSEDEEDRRRRRQRRSRSRSRGRSAERRKEGTTEDATGAAVPTPAAAKEEENEAGATLPVPPPPVVPDTRATTKILADAPPKEVALAPPPPRRRRRPVKPAASGQPAAPPPVAAAKPTAAPVLAAAKPTAAPVLAAAPASAKRPRRSPSPPKRGRPPRAPVGHEHDAEEDDDDDDLGMGLETEKEREEREMAERRARREKLLAQYGGSGGGGGGGGGGGRGNGSGSSVPPSPSRISPAASTSSLEQQEKVASKKEDKGGTEKASKEQQVQLRKFLESTRRQREEELGGAGELLLGDEEDGVSVGGADQVAAAEASGVLKHAEEGVGGAAGGNGKEETMELDIFSAEGATMAAVLLKEGRGGGLGALGKGGLKEQRDAEGYFSHRVGETLRGRYKILGTKGRGVFSSVLLAQDEQASAPVAIKVLRGNDLMLQAGQKEAALLRDLTQGDPKEQGHIIRFLDEFKLGEHLCVVMEAMHLNLRKLLKTYGATQGLSIKAVLSYTQQLLVGLTYLRNKGVVHADLKPDNLVVNETMSILKICDFGSAMRTQEVEELGEAPYLQSRFYRAPEVILGYGPQGPAMDMWSAAASMYEMYTAKVMFPGRHNNEIVKQMMEIRGPFAKKLLKKASPLLRKQHFDDDCGHFLSRELDRVTQVESVRSVVPPLGPTKQLSEMLCPPRVAAKMPGDVKAGVALLQSFLEQALVLDPSKRAEPVAALQLFKTGGSGGGGGGGGGGSGGK